MRAGAQTLLLLSVPFNVGVLKGLGEGPRSRADLRRELGHPPETTMRTQLRRLEQLGILEGRRQSGFPGPMELALGQPGTDLLRVAQGLEEWLARSPEGPLALGTLAAKSSIKALTDGWTTGMLRALAARPLSLTDLDRLIGDVTYPSLERRLVAMRGVGLLRSLAANPQGTPHVVTPWMRIGLIPLVACVRWESRHLADSNAITQRDIETVFLLGLPLLRLPSALTGSCRLSVEIGADGRDGRIGTLAEFVHGRLRSASSRLTGKPAASVTGSLAAWFSAVLDRDEEALERFGDAHLSDAVNKAVTSRNALHSAEPDPPARPTRGISQAQVRVP